MNHEKRFSQEIVLKSSYPLPFTMYICDIKGWSRQEKRMKFEKLKADFFNNTRICQVYLTNWPLRKT